MMSPHKATLFTGPMWAGKTTGIIDMAHDTLGSGGAVAAIKWTGDDRNAAIQDHDGRRLDERIAMVCVPSLAEAVHLMHGESYELVIIDEGQFFQDLASGVAKLLERCNVAISALDADYHQRPFGPVTLLRETVDVTVVKLTARCGTGGCGNPAEHTVRLAHGDSPRGGGSNPIAVGGADMYRAACTGCLGRA